ncbi:ornithine carbamoyltransferase [Kitasatospora sp. NPDC093806]|uniref:ornithine carbamoyltransferase n=1 Tax=Kitasatospora sp. NPDC093806 TaxID=3155075 RepID=UPI003432C7DB
MTDVIQPGTHAGAHADIHPDIHADLDLGGRPGLRSGGHPGFHTGPAPVREAAGVFSLGALDRDVVHGLVERSCELYADPTAHRRPLAGKVVGVLFAKTSTRTRTAFTSGVVRLGGTPIAYGPNDLQTNTGETLLDTGRILGSMLDLLVARTAGPLDDLYTISRAGGIPVVNAMAAEEHPTQGICDLASIRMMRGSVDGARVLYLGEGNNTATALAEGLAHHTGCTAVFATPPGYGVPAGVLAAAAERGRALGTEITEVQDVAELPAETDFVYTTRWQTTGTVKNDDLWRETFRPFYVDDALMSRWPAAWFMHDLPANRGEEVSARTLDGPRSIAWSQARMKLASAMAVLEWVAGQR